MSHVHIKTLQKLIDIKNNTEDLPKTKEKAERKFMDLTGHAVAEAQSIELIELIMHCRRNNTEGSKIYERANTWLSLRAPETSCSIEEALENKLYPLAIHKHLIAEKLAKVLVWNSC